METKLLPCPFCGGPAEIVGAGEGGWVVQCRPCAATSGEGDPISIPIAAWNRRVERTAQGVTDEARGRAAYEVHLASGRHMDMVTARMLVDTALTAALNPKPEVSK
jgi:hypothetical protein